MCLDLFGDFRVLTTQNKRIGAADILTDCLMGSILQKSDSQMFNIVFKLFNNVSVQLFEDLTANDKSSLDTKSSHDHGKFYTNVATANEHH